MGAPLGKSGLTPRATVILLVAAVALGLATFHRLVWADLPGPVFEFSGETMGTTFLVKVVAPSMGRSEHARVASRITGRLEELNASLSTWDPDSEISRLNRHAQATPFAVGDDLATVLAAAREVSEASGGAFDPTVRPLVQAWGFGDHARLPGGPSAVELAGLLERVGWERLRVEPGGVVKSRPDVVVDLSAIAKGYGVDAVSHELLALGYPSHLVEIGGELQARGQRPDGSPWRVAIEEPDAGSGRVVHRVLPLVDSGMATSGDYRSYYEKDGARISHTIDPRDGRPIRHQLASVTVLDPETMYADAWATALHVLGPDEGYRLAASRQLAAYFIVRQKDGTFRTRATPAFPAALAAASQPAEEP